MTDEGLKEVYKGFNLSGDELVDRLRAFRHHGVHVLGSFIFGLPSDRKDTFDATVALAQKADVTFAQFVLLTPFPGTIDFEKWAAEPEHQATKVDGVPVTQHWLIPQHKRPKLYSPHPTMTIEEIRVGTQGAWDSFYSWRRVWARAKVVKSLEGTPRVRADFEAVPPDVREHRHRDRQRARGAIGAIRAMDRDWRSAGCSSRRRCRISRCRRRAPKNASRKCRFAHLKLHPNLLRGVKDLGFTRPTPIQSDAIPPAMQGRDLLATATTGSGKTAAFLLPILHQLIDEPRGTTRALVLTPTRELAAQIVEDLNDLAVHTPLTAAAVFGGVGMGPQEHAFRSGVDVIVGTPGRLLDHFRAPYAKLSGLKYLVLDEADRMLDMGFLPDIRRVLRHLPTRRQTLFFSATMPPAIGELAREMLRDPATINMSQRATPAVGITQAVYPVPQHLKAPLLVELLKRGEIQDALVFTRTKHRADRVARYARRSRAFKVERIHGNRSQAQRTQALAGSRAGSTACSSRPTSRRAASTSRRSDTSSTSTCRPCPRTTSTGSAGRRARRRRERRFRSSHRKRKATCARSSARSTSDCRA